LIELLSADLLVFGLAWYWNFKRARERNEPDGRAAMWGGGALLVFALLIFQVAPYRVLYQSEAERVTYGGDRCYLVGQRLSEALLFCPRRPPPFDQIVKIDDPTLKREGRYESIFAAADELR
jgi:hypothetical protein